MGNQQGTSFIPKSPVRGAVKPAGVRKVYIFTYVSSVFFFGTLLATAGTFFYNISIDSQLSSQKARLSEERSSFNQSDLERVRELETRMKTAFNILDGKVSLHSLLIALEDTTLRSVQIVGLEYKKDVNNSLNLALLITTTNFNASLFQREIFSGNTVLKGSSVSEIIFTDGAAEGDSEVLAESEVTFTVSKELTKADIPYEVTTFSAPATFVEEVDETETVTEADVITSDETEIIGQ